MAIIWPCFSRLCFLDTATRLVDLVDEKSQHATPPTYAALLSAAAAAARIDSYDSAAAASAARPARRGSLVPSSHWFDSWLRVTRMSLRRHDKASVVRTLQQFSIIVNCASDQLTSACFYCSLVIILCVAVRHHEWWIVLWMSWVWYCCVLGQMLSVHRLGQHLPLPRSRQRRFRSWC